jgi:hypothetical protein
MYMYLANAPASADRALEIGRISLDMAEQDIICKRLWLVP